MDLASGCPFWPLNDGILRAYPSLTEDVSCQVAIVGAGVTGALAAYYLGKEGVDVVVVDKRDVGTGSTGACTGLLQYEIDVPLHQLAGRIGEDAAKRAYLASHRAIDDLAGLVRELGVDCGFARRESLYLASRKADAAGLRAELEARRAIGIDVGLVPSDELAGRFGVRAPCAMRSTQAGEIDAYRFTHALVRAAVEWFGVRTFARTGVDDVRAFRNRVDLTTANGQRIRADRVLFASGYETQRYLRSRRVKLKTTYATVSEPAAHGATWGDRPIVWETARPYFYARGGPDGRMMMGGADDDFTEAKRRAAALPTKVRWLGRKYARTFIDAPPFRPVFSWAGVFGESDDGLPLVGGCGEGGMPRAYYAVGYGGNGVTFAVIAARIIRDMYLRREGEESRLFCFERTRDAT